MESKQNRPESVCLKPPFAKNIGSGKCLVISGSTETEAIHVIVFSYLGNFREALWWAMTYDDNQTGGAGK